MSAYSMIAQHTPTALEAHSLLDVLFNGWEFSAYLKLLFDARHLNIEQ